MWGVHGSFEKVSDQTADMAIAKLDSGDRS